MFYPSGQGNNDNSARVPAQNILNNYAFTEIWPQDLSQTELDEGEQKQCNI